MIFSISRLRYLLIGVLCLMVLALIAVPSKSYAASWTQVNTDGFGSADNITAIRLIDFNDHIYAAVGNAVNGARVFRYDSGTTWTQVNTDGFGDANNGEIILTTFNSILYAATINNVTGFELWKSTNGATWAQVGTSGFGDANSTGIEGVIVFHNRLYLGVDNVASGTKIYRLNSSDQFTQVNTDGFGDAANTESWSMDVFNDTLYVGTGNANGGEVWHSTDGTTWVEDMDGGFGDVGNVRMTALFHIGGYLYAGTMNGLTGTEVWRTVSGTSWEQVNTDGFGDANNTWTGDQVAVINGRIFLGTRNVGGTGAQLYTSTNGKTWTQEGSDGFGDVNNFAIYAITLKSSIYLGFSNMTTGAQIWASGARDALTITTETLGDETVGSSYTVQLETSSGTTPITYRLTDGSLPDGQTLSSDGIISGTPTVSGVYSFTVTVADGGTPRQIASREFSITVIDAPANPVVAVLPETGANLSFCGFN